MFWESERLLFRHAVMSDAEALFRIYGDPQTHTFNPAGPHPDIERSRQSLERRIANRKLYGFDDWAIAEKNHPDHIIGFGGIFVSEFNGEMTNNLGYRFEPDAWGKGYATELSMRAIEYGFEDVGLKQIVGVVRENHFASRRVLEKAGMKFIERIMNNDNLPAALKFAILSTEWRGCRAK
jgi:[ribosomal protein S5]-alanine N-acetyltransferase